MLTAFLVLVIVGLLGLLGVTCFYLYRFVTYIIIIENDLSEAVDVFNRSKEMMEKMLAPNTLFADSPEARRMLNECLDDIKMCKLATQTVVDKFTRLSKKKYIQVIEAGRKEEEVIEDETWA